MQIDDKAVEAAKKAVTAIIGEHYGDYDERVARAALEAALSTIPATALTVDALAEKIRRVDGSNALGAGALAEALMPFLSAIPAPAGEWPKDPETGLNDLSLVTLLRKTREDAAPAGRAEAVGEAGEMPGSNGGFTMAVFKASDVPLGTKLYAAPPVAGAVASLDERMKAAGMIPLSDLLAGNTPLERWMPHTSVRDLDSFERWLMRKHREYMTMRMGYELGDKGKGDELFEWILAHAGAFSEVVSNFRAMKERAAPPAAEAVNAEREWQALLEKDDRTSPAEYPEMALITFEELREIIANAAHPAAEVAIKPLEWVEEAHEPGWWTAWDQHLLLGYEVRINSRGVVRVRSPGKAWHTFDGDADAAKAALQADRASRIRSALVSAPASLPDGDSQDRARLDTLHRESWDLRCFDIPTGGDDYDIGWRVVGHWQAKPHERVIAEVYTDDPRAAIDAAIRAPANAEGGDRG